MLNSYPVKRNPDGWVTENCPTNPGVKIGSFDCTANCKNNKTPRKEIEKYAFDLPHINCDSKETLKTENQQLTIEI